MHREAQTDEKHRFRTVKIRITLTFRRQLRADLRPPADKQQVTPLLA